MIALCINGACSSKLLREKGLTTFEPLGKKKK